MARIIVASLGLIVLSGCSAVVTARQSCDGEHDFCPTGTTCRAGDCVRDGGDADLDADADAELDGDFDADSGVQCNGLTYPTDATYNTVDLHGYERVAGSLIIEDTSLVTLDFLSCLRQIDGELIIENNADLTSFAGLDHIERVGGLSIADNSGLDDVTGLARLTRIDGRLRIWNNDSLPNVDGLDSVTDIDGIVTIAWNSMLIDLVGLDHVEQVGGGIYIMNNESLPNCEGTDFRGQIDGFSGEACIYNNQADTCEEVEDGVCTG